MWKETTLGEICEFVRGPFGGSLKKNIFVKEGYAVYEQQHAINNQCKNFRYYINQEKFLEMQRFIVKSGDILMSCSGTIGKTTIVPEDAPVGIINQALLKITTSNVLNIHFLKFYMQSKLFHGQLMETVDGAAIKNVASVKILKNITINLPPLAEQERIVAKLDAAFAEIDDANLKTKKAINQARLLSQKIIDHNLDSKLSDTNKVQLKNFCNIKHGYAFDGKSFSPSDDESKPIVLTPGNFAEDGTTKFTQKNTKRLHDKYDDSLLFSENNLVVVMTDLSSKMLLLGKPAFIKDTNILHNQRIGLVQNNEQTILNEYLYFYFKSTKYLSEIKRTASGTMVRHTAPKRILDNYINAPESLTSQRQISDKISNLLFDIAILISFYEDKTSNLFALKSVILSQELQPSGAA